MSHQKFFDTCRAIGAAVLIVAAVVVVKYLLASFP